MVEVTQLMFPLLGLVLLGGGVALVRQGREYGRQSERVAETPVSDVDSLRRGTVAVEGTARVDEDAGTVTTALTGEAALVSRSKVTAKQDNDTGDDDGTRSHATIHEERRSVPFLVEDATGTVRVDPPEDGTVRLDGNVETEYSRGVPDASDLAADPEAAADGGISVGDSHQWRDYRRRYEQAAVVPGEDVYVLGEAVDRADWDGGDFEITGGDDPDGFVVSDLSREAVRSGGKVGAYLAYAFGGFLGLLGALMLLGGLSAVLGG